VNALDFAVLGLILLWSIRGYSRGFFREIFGLAAWVGAGLAAYLLGPAYGPPVAQRYGLPIAIAEAAAGLALFVAIYLVCQLVGWILCRIARLLFLGPVDRAGGLVLGAAKAVAAAAVFCMVVTSRRGLPDLAERVHDSPMLSGLVDHGWEVVAIAREESGLNPSWQHPYSKAELGARATLNRFLTPKPESTPKAATTPPPGGPSTAGIQVTPPRALFGGPR
jgi:membrane protein required for colicin V production